jgi:phage tail-like protein
MTIGRSDPAASFRFKVAFRGGPGVRARFTECAGLEFEAATFDYKEGGEHSRVHRLPGPVAYGNLTLSRGVAADGEKLWQWVRQMARGQIETCAITISLLDARAQTVREWTFIDAYPVKWSATTFSAGQNAIAIETLTIAHQGLLLS